MPFVLDASITLAWYFDDEYEPYADSVLHRLRDDTAVVPSIWLLEVANVLVVARRRNRLASEKVESALGALMELPIDVRDSAGDQVFGSVMRLAQEHGLTVYDAAYLDLAITEQLPMATVDARLRAAAGRAGIPVV